MNRSLDGETNAGQQAKPVAGRRAFLKPIDRVGGYCLKGGRLRFSNGLTNGPPRGPFMITAPGGLFKPPPSALETALLEQTIPIAIAIQAAFD